MSSILPGVLSGAAFGAALTASGVYQPSIIITQLRFEDWHMLRAFLTATAGSATVAAVLQNIGYVKLSPRGYSTLALFSRVDANIIGGSLLGAGMALSGACPGTVASQAALGITSGYWALAGGALGGLAWTGAIRDWVARRKASKELCEKKSAPTSNGTATPQPQPRPLKLTVYENLGVSYVAAVVGFELLMGVVVRGISGSVGGSATTTTTTSPIPHYEHPIPPVVGGLFIAAAQLVSVLARKAVIGTSSVFEEIGDHVWWLTRSSEPTQKAEDEEAECKTTKRPCSNTIVFVAGIMLGSLAVARALPELVNTRTVVSALPAALGGFTMVVGARMAGGCTSGHGISGVSLLSVSSMITIGCAFAVGSLVAKALY